MADPIGGTNWIAYDEANRLKIIDQRPDRAAALLARYEYTHDPAGRLIIDWQDGAPVAAWTYDTAGNRETQGAADVTTT